MSAVAPFSSMFVAIVLLYSGLIHAAQPYYFIHTIASYRLLPSVVSGIVGLLLPSLQIVLAVCIGLRIAEKGALWTSASLFAVFAAAQGMVLARGLEVDCGCFGFVARPVSFASAGLPVALFVACVLALGQGRRQRRTG